MTETIGNDPALVGALAGAVEQHIRAASGVETLAAALAPKIAETLTGQLAAEVAARLRIDVLAGEDLILSRQEAARFLGRSEKTLELWASRGTGPNVTRLGPRSIGYRVGDLRKFAEGRPNMTGETVRSALAATTGA